MKKEYEFLGKKYTATEILAGALAVLSFFILLYVVIPQFTNMGEQREAVNIVQERINTLEQSNSVLKQTDSAKLAEDLRLVNRALPNNKNIVSIFSTISHLASESNIALEGFTIKVGELYTKDEGKQKDQMKNEVGVPTLDVVISIGMDDSRDIVEFTNKLYKTLPVAQIKTLDTRENKGTLEISFYYRAFNFDNLNTDRIPKYEAEYGDTITTLRSWGSEE